MKNKKGKDFITIQEAERRQEVRNIMYTPRINKVNVCIGSVSVLYGVATIILPTGSIFAISLGVSLFLCPIPINRLVYNIVNDIKFKVGCWL